jgi:hypothetical protein
MPINNILVYMAPWLLCAWLISLALEPLMGRLKVPKYSAALAGLIISAIPISELSLTHLALSINPHFSTGSLILFGALLYQRGTGHEIFSRFDRSIFYTWNTVLGIVLYAGALGFADYDLYAAGYGAEAYLIFFVAAVGFTILGSPIVLIFVAAIVLHIVGAQTTNIFDAHIDGVLFIFSVCALLCSIVMRGIKRQRKV